MDYPARRGRPHRCSNTRASTAGPTYTATIEFPDTQVGAEYSWGVIADSGSGRDLWAIPTEVPDPDSAARQRTFTLAPDPSEQHYWLSTSRQLGANPRWTPDGAQRIQRFTAVLPRAGFVVFRRL